MSVVNFDALAQAGDIRIERRQVVFLCWKQDSNLSGSQTPNRQQTECSLTNRLSYRGSSSLGRDLMRERTRSRIQDGGPQKRSANTVAFLPFNVDFATRNWCPLKFVFRMNTCDIKFDRICPWLLLGSVWKLTQDARTNLTWCANVHCIKTTDARTHIKMR